VWPPPPPNHKEKKVVFLSVSTLLLMQTIIKNKVGLHNLGLLDTVAKPKETLPSQSVSAVQCWKNHVMLRMLFFFGKSYLFVLLWWRKIIYHCANRKTADTNVVFSGRGRPLEFRSSSLRRSTFSLFCACGTITIISGWRRTATFKRLNNFAGTDWSLYVAVCFQSITTAAQNWWHVLHILSLSTNRTEE